MHCGVSDRVIGFESELNIGLSDMEELNLFHVDKVLHGGELSQTRRRLPLAKHPGDGLEGLVKGRRGVRFTCAGLTPIVVHLVAARTGATRDSRAHPGRVRRGTVAHVATLSVLLVAVQTFRTAEQVRTELGLRFRFTDARGAAI